MTEAYTVATLEEWGGWLKDNSRRYNEKIYATGELADQVRARFGGEPDMPVWFIIGWDMSRFQDVLNIDCGYSGVWLKDVAFVIDNPDDLEHVRDWLEGKAA